jgi:hypothetical protein
MENKNIIIYSVFSGTIYEIPEKDKNHLDISHIPLKEYPKTNYKQNYGRLYTGRDMNNFAYYAAPSVLKVIDHNISSNLIDKNKIKV